MITNRNLCPILFTLALLSCQPSEQRLTHDQRTAIADTIRLLTNQLMRTSEQLDAEKLCSFYSKSPEFRSFGDISYFPRSPQMRHVVQRWTLSTPDSFSAAVRRGFALKISQTYTLDEPFVNVLTPRFALSAISGKLAVAEKDNQNFVGRYSWVGIWALEQDQWKVLLENEYFGETMPEKRPGKR